MAAFEIVAGLAALKLLSDDKGGSSGGGGTGTGSGDTVRAPPTSGSKSPADQARDTVIAAGITAGVALASAGVKAGVSAVGGALSGGGALHAGAQALGVAAYIAEQGALGYAITGDLGGAIAGIAAPAPALGTAGGFIVSQGNVANVGRVLGQWLDKFLGGDGKTSSGRGLAFQVTGFIAGLAVAFWGLYAIPIVGELAAIAWGVISAIDDASKVAYGQQGLLNDMRKAAHSFFIETRDRGRNAALSANPDLAHLEPSDEVRLAACAAVMAIGYAREDVNQRWRRFTVHAPGGPAAPNDGGWAAARGYHLLAANQTALFQFITALAAAPVQVANDVNLMTGTYPLYLAQGQTEIAKISSDDHFNLDQRGVALQNVAHYLNAMTQVWGIGAGATGNAVWWRDVEKAFFGDVSQQSGDLFANVGGDRPGVIVNWQQSAAVSKPVLIFEMDFPTAQMWQDAVNTRGPWV